MPKVTQRPKKQFTIRIDADTADHLEAYADKTRINKSVHAQVALAEYLNKRFPDWIPGHEQDPA